MASPATHVVVRPFPGPDGPLTQGAEVPASGWRNTDSLVRRRYLRPIEKPAQSISTPRALNAIPTAGPNAKRKER
jgi:hypothetical protein